MRLWKLPVMFFSLGILFLLIGCVSPAESEKTAGAGLAISKGCYDADNDGYGKKGNSIAACPGSTSVYDCDDNNAAVSPNTREICDGLDNDCNSQVDEGCDDDGDRACDINMVTQVNPDPQRCYWGGDCDDNDPLRRPFMSESCNGFDDDCDSEIDEGCCGNGLLESAEECDDGNRIETDECTNTCQLSFPPACGNGRCETYENDVANPNYCARDCAVCGNGILESGEICDDSNTIDGDGCTQCQCADSDGGIDQYEGGTVTTSAGAMNDYCDQKVAIDPSRSIFERYCGDDGTAQVIEKRCGDDINPLYSNEFLASGQGCYLDDPSIPSCIIYG